MRFALSILCFLISALPLNAQVTIQGDTTTILLGNDGRRPGTSKNVTTKIRTEVTAAEAAVLRGLDKLSGESEDIVMTRLVPLEFGRLEIIMHDCRYPRNNPNGDAYVHLTIVDKGLDQTVFQGWMVASSPGLSALDHPRYDVWAIRCKLDNRTPAVVAGESSPRPLERPEGLGGN